MLARGIGRRSLVEQLKLCLPKPVEKLTLRFRNAEILRRQAFVSETLHFLRMTSNGEKQSATTCINPRISLAFARDTFDKLSISAYGLDTVQAPQFWQRGSVFSLPRART